MICSEVQWLTAIGESPAADSPDPASGAEPASLLLLPATVTEHIRRLRMKLEADREHPRWLRTVRGVGCRFDP